MSNGHGTRGVDAARPATATGFSSGVHIAKPGETLESIARYRGVSPEQILRENPALQNRGMQLNQPVPTGMEVRLPSRGRAGGPREATGTAPSEGDPTRAPALLRAATARDIPTNVMALEGPVGPNRGSASDVGRVQRRLEEIGLLAEGTYQHGVSDAATTAAIRRFQTTSVNDSPPGGRELIEQIRNDSRNDMYDPLPLPARNSAEGPRPGLPARGQSSSAGHIQPQDATHQALANAWPRTINGQRMNEAEAYQYLSNTIQERFGSFEPGRVNVIGIRGYQGGGTHDNPNVFRRNNQYDDSFFVLRMENGQPRVREFRGTVDPGNTDQGRNVPRSLDANQQNEYRLSYGHSNFENRPIFYRSQAESEDRASLEGGSAAGRQRGGAGPSYGIALHSGGRGNDVGAYSMGCQVPHGDWYPSFVEEVRRGLPRGQGSILYSLIDNPPPPRISSPSRATSPAGQVVIR